MLFADSALQFAESTCILRIPVTDVDWQKPSFTTPIFVKCFFFRESHKLIRIPQILLRILQSRLFLRLFVLAICEWKSI